MRMYVVCEVCNVHTYREAQATRAKVAARVRAASVMMKMFRTLREEEQVMLTCSHLLKCIMSLFIGGMKILSRSALTGC